MKKTKLCPRCKIEKILSDFTIDRTKSSGYKSHCKDCCKKHQKEYELKNKDKVKKWKQNYYQNNKERIKEKDKKRRNNREYKDKRNAQFRKWYKNNPEGAKNYALRNSYNITLKEYNEMYERQNGCCAICGQHQSKTNGALNVDHNHSTKQIRGLLCTRCNLALGYIEKYIKNKVLFDKAIKYLKKYE